MFRSVSLPENVDGRLLLHSMPGWNEQLDTVVRKMKEAGVTLVVSLAPLDEVEQKSPCYHTAITSRDFPFDRIEFGIEDYDAPSDRKKFRDFVSSVRERIRSGDVILVHCGAGRGRTGMFAVCLLLALGVSKAAAQEAVTDAGSGPERSSQNSLIDWFETQVAGI